MSTIFQCCHGDFKSVLPENICLYCHGDRIPVLPNSAMGDLCFCRGGSRVAMKIYIWVKRERESNLSRPMCISYMSTPIT